MALREGVSLVYEDGKFICHCAFKDRDIPKNAHFWWNGYQWETNSARCASRIMEYGDNLAKIQIRGMLHHKGRKLNPVFIDGLTRTDNRRTKTKYRYNM